MPEDHVIGLPRPVVEGIDDPLTELLRLGARRLLAQAVEVEVAEFLGRVAGQNDAQGRAAVVRNGYLPGRDVLTGIGPVQVRVPKVCSRFDEATVFRSSLVPPYIRRAGSVGAALPWLYLKGITTGQMAETLSPLPIVSQYTSPSADICLRFPMKEERKGVERPST